MVFVGLNENTITTMSDLLTRSVELADAGLIIGERTEVNLNDIVDSISSKLIPEGITFVRDDLPSVKCDGVKKWVGCQIPGQELKTWLFPN